MATRDDRVRVVLTPAECRLAEAVARARREFARRNGFVQGAEFTGTDDQALRNDVVGTKGEMAVAKHYGVFWTGTIGEIDQPDVKRLEVRSTLLDEGCLLVKPKNPDDRAFVLVVLSCAADQREEWCECSIVGWIWGGEAKRDRWLRDPNGRPPAYFVPQVCLAPLVMLPPSEYA